MPKEQTTSDKILHNENRHDSHEKVGVMCPYHQTRPSMTLQRSSYFFIISFYCLSLSYTPNNSILIMFSSRKSETLATSWDIFFTASRLKKGSAGTLLCLLLHGGHVHQSKSREAKCLAPMGRCEGYMNFI